MSDQNQIQPFDFAVGREITKSKGIDEDFETSRKNLMSMMETTMGAIRALSVIAFQSQDPDAYDVLNKMFKTYGDQQAQLLQMYRIKECRDRPATPRPVQGEIVDHRPQNLFVGPPAELAKMLETTARPETN